MNDEQTLEPAEKRRRLKEIQLPDDRKIIKHPDFEVAWPERVTWVGFAVVFIICVLIILATGWIGKLFV